ncbi:6352_t:CDS:2 [Entrophospora sp. SA101]|nr:8123_t:CDS:2 [Entrophospora sp. SA101]CAJ0758028.1 6352_t:CDS:2 [Entrophospora sp. SA101]CAJ0840636.1 17540_t:CDS:2 [Entrophospora sp. SA101]CAJ0867785.1 8045_t:CDS:2 [Entrophospora sp. SA101]
MNYRRPKPSIPTLCENLLQWINELENKTTVATKFLPAYDQRQSNLSSLNEEKSVSTTATSTDTAAVSKVIDEDNFQTVVLNN